MWMHPSAEVQARLSWCWTTPRRLAFGPTLNLTVNSKPRPDLKPHPKTCPQAEHSLELHTPYIAYVMRCVWGVWAGAWHDPRQGSRCCT